VLFDKRNGLRTLGVKDDFGDFIHLFFFFPNELESKELLKGMIIGTSILYKIIN